MYLFRYRTPLLLRAKRTTTRLVGISSKIGFVIIGLSSVIWNQHMADTWQLRDLGPKPVRRVLAAGLGAAMIFVGVQAHTGALPS
jgi:hypothetical protein